MFLHGPATVRCVTSWYQKLQSFIGCEWLIAVRQLLLLGSSAPLVISGWSSACWFISVESVCFEVFSKLAYSNLEQLGHVLCQFCLFKVSIGYRVYLSFGWPSCPFTLYDRVHYLSAMNRRGTYTLVWVTFVSWTPKCALKCFGSGMYRTVLHWSELVWALLYFGLIFFTFKIFKSIF
jgi:hypothetical protein